MKFCPSFESYRKKFFNVNCEGKIKEQFYYYYYWNYITIFKILLSYFLVDNFMKMTSLKILIGTIKLEISLKTFTLLKANY